MSLRARREATVVLAASDHGLGHATRCAAVGKALAHRGVRVAFRSSAPTTIFEGVGPVVAGPTDVGLIQADAMSYDLGQTCERWADWISRWPALVALEAARIRDLEADLVVADLPPLAIAAAAHLGIPAIAMGNFGWDWIHEEFARVRGNDAHRVVARHIAAHYARAEHLLRLPLSEPMRAFRSQEAIGLVARRARSTREATRHRLALPDSVTVALLSFGGGGLADLDVAGLLEDTQDTVFLAPGFPDVGLPRFVPLSFDEVFHPDLVLAADVVVSKPGYGIVSECLAHGRPMLYALRGDFPEQPILAGVIDAALRGRCTPLEALRAGRIGADLRALAAAGRGLVGCDTWGADQAAERLAARARVAARARRA